MPATIRSVILCLTILILTGTLYPLQAAEQVRLRIQGIEGELLQNVEAALAPPDGLLRDNKVDQPWLDYYVSQAETRVKTALEPFGYYLATSSSALTGTQDDGFILTVAVKPGEPVRLTQVKVEAQGAGATENDITAAITTFPLKAGDLLRHQNYETGKGALLSRAQSLGYLDAIYTTHEIQVSTVTGTAQITLLLQTGQRYRFGQVTFEGAPLYSDELLRRYVAFKTGAPFSYDRLGRTHSNLSGSGYFKEVTLLPAKEEAVNFEVPVRVLLKPAPGRTLRPGFGYGTDTGFRGSLSYKELNLLGRGHVLTVETTISENLQGIAAGYVIPDPESLRNTTGFQANLQREDVSTYLSSLAAVEINQSRSFGGGQMASAYLRFQYELYTSFDPATTNSVTGQKQSTARLVMPGLRFSGRKYDNITRPANGHNYALELRGTHHLLGSDTDFIQAIAEGAHLMSFPGRLTLGLRGKVGATWQGDPLAQLPSSLRFYAGGDTSVRGYSYKSLGPTDLQGEVTGGRNLLQGSVELERSLFDNWGISLFYDTGNAFQSFTDFSLHQGTGVGLHYYTRVGGLNLSLARQIGIANPGFHVHFTIGFQP